MSTGPQLKGDSLRRQVERSEKFARENSLTLDTAFRLADIGMSGFTGENLERGDLGKFLIAVRAGQIAKGSYLIVESLDRLSRAKARSSLRVFLELLDAGIVIASLIDGHVYTADSDHSELILSLGVMQRAHDESRTKSDRGAAAWEAKRKNAGTKILTSTTRTWLKPRADRTGFEVIEARAKVVRRIFSDCADRGMGVKSIAVRLNSEGVKPFGPKGRGWSKTFILRLLRSRSVLGEFQPSTRVGGKNRPAGDVIANYYEPILDEAVFYRAQNAINKRRGAGGRKGTNFTNLFGKIAFCAGCGAKLHVVNKGVRGGRALACVNASDGLGECRPVFWKLTDFELSFLTFVKEIDLGSLTSSVVDQHERQAVDAEIQAKRGRLEETKVQRDRAFQLIVEGESDYLKQKLRELDALVVELEERLAGLTEKRRQLSTETERFAQSRVEIAGLIEQIHAQTGHQAFVLRSTLASRLRDLVDAVYVFPGHPSTDRKRRSSAASHEGRFFNIQFRDATFRTVYPSADDPTKFEALAASDEGAVNDHLVRNQLRHSGIENPTPEQYDEMTERLRRTGSPFLNPSWEADVSSAERGDCD
jgi:DNA invertase Pin-like site-specific DNA recombinase